MNDNEPTFMNFIWFFVVIFFILFMQVPIAWVIMRGYLSFTLFITILFDLWLIRSIRRGALSFPLHTVWSINCRSKLPHTYYCQQCGRKAIYCRNLDGTIKYDMYSGKKKDERTYSYHYACPAHGKLDIVVEEGHGLFELENIEQEIMSVSKTISKNQP